MLKEVPDDRLGLRLINLISATLARLFVFYSRCHFCMCCGAAKSRGNLLLPAGSGPGWMPVHGFLGDSAENLNTFVCVCVCSCLSPWVRELMLESHSAAFSRTTHVSGHEPLRKTTLHSLRFSLAPPAGGESLRSGGPCH